MQCDCLCAMPLKTIPGLRDTFRRQHALPGCPSLFGVSTCLRRKPHLHFQSLQAKSTWDFSRSLGFLVTSMLGAFPRYLHTVLLVKSVNQLHSTLDYVAMAGWTWGEIHGAGTSNIPQSPGSSSSGGTDDAVLPLRDCSAVLMPCHNPSGNSEVWRTLSLGPDLGPGIHGKFGVKSKRIGLSGSQEW